MRITRLLTAASALLVPTLVLAGAPIVGTLGNRPCTGIATDPAELYLTKVTSNGADARTDFLFDLRAKGGQQSNAGTQYASGGWSAASAWRVQLAPYPNNLVYAVLTAAPETPGGPGRFAVDSGTLADFDALINRLQEVGNSIPAGELNSIGLTLPGTSSQFGVQVRPGNVKQFPVGTTTNAINVAFAMAIDINDTGSATGCSWGAEHSDPLVTTETFGAIQGYNIYRIPGSAGTVPTPADVMAAVRTATETDGGWVGFVDMRTLHQGVADTPVPPGTYPSPSPLEINPNADIGGMQNPNGVINDADEVLIFQDSANTPGGSPRPGGAVLAPNVTGQSYWYFAQPAIVGNVAEFTGTVGFTTNLLFSGVHVCDLDGDGVGAGDGVDLDAVPCNTASPEFISPQAEYGLPGLGLTFNNLPLLSSGMFHDSGRALPAGGQVRLSGSATGSSVSLQFTTGLEQGSVLGYNVYRVVGENRVRVNEQPILAQGSESNVYTLADAATQVGRGVTGGALTYMVETVYSDGTPSTFAGPFTVELGQQPAVRRRR